MNNNFNELIKKSFLYYDNNNLKFNNLINNNNIELKDDKLEILFKNDNKKFKFEILGIFDNQTNVWLWGWMFPNVNNKKIILVKKLLEYGLSLDINETNLDNDDGSAMFYIRTQLINSRFLLDDSLQLEIHLALSNYLLKDNIKFIYPIKKYLDKNKKKFLTTYYLIKN